MNKYERDFADWKQSHRRKTIDRLIRRRCKRSEICFATEDSRPGCCIEYGIRSGDGNDIALDKSSRAYRLIPCIRESLENIPPFRIGMYGIYGS